MFNFITASRNRITIQMVVWFAAISLLPLAVATYVNYKNAAKELNLLVSENLEAISQRQSNEIKTYLKNQERFVSILSLSSDVVRSLVVLNRIDQAMGNIAGQDSSQIEELRQSFTPILKGLMDQFDFTQMFLINIDGNVNLSIGEGTPDYSNLLTGSLKDSELSLAFKRTLMLMTPQMSNFTAKGEKGGLFFYVTSPVLSEGKLVGIIALQIDASKIYEISEDYSGLGKTGETLIGAMVGDDIVILNPTRHAEKAKSGFNLTEQGLHDAALEKALKGDRGSGTSFDYRKERVIAAWEYLPRMRWGLVVKQDIKETHLPVVELRRLSIVIAGGTLIIVLGAAILVAKSITQPIISLTEIATRIAHGDLTSTVKKVPSNEIGILAKAIETMAKNLKSLVSKVKDSGRQVAATTHDVSTTVQEQAKAAQETGSASLEIADSARKISVTAKELTGTMQEVSEVAQDTALLAESGVDGLHVMEKSMNELSEANHAVSSELSIIQEKAGAIDSIITTITKVADQTNLLSLNAAIEARKAGEYGRGFKVVAREIKRLADQTAESTLEIEKMIHGMLDSVHNGVGAMKNLSDKVEYGVREISTVSNHLGNVIQQVQGLPPRFEMVLQGMQSQTNDADSIKDSISLLNKSAQKTISTLEETMNKLNRLSKTAGALQSEISRFQTEE